jgi:hypothetical protein
VLSKTKPAVFFASENLATAGLMSAVGSGRAPGGRFGPRTSPIVRAEISCERHPVIPSCTEALACAVCGATAGTEASSAVRRAGHGA